MSKKHTYILGISAHFHDSAAVLLKDGKIIAAAQEERFSRIKHDPLFPERAIEYCLKEAGIKGSDLNYVGFFEIPFLKFERLIISYAQHFPKSYKQYKEALPIWLKSKLWVTTRIRNTLDYYGEIIIIPHHLSHAASAFYCSEFEESAILTVDGVGEWDTTTLGIGKGNDITLLKHISYPHSLGLLYSAITYYLGFKVNSAEYKVMGLAPYGNPTFLAEFEKLIEIKDDGSFKLNTDYFSYEYGDVMITDKVGELFGMPVRTPEGELTQFHFDVARSLQHVTEEVMLKSAKYLKELTGAKNICLAGGVGLNCVANGELLRSRIFDNIFIQPASGDAGGALGVALHIHNNILRNPREVFDTLYFGSGYTKKEIKDFLTENNISFKEFSRNALIDYTAGKISEGSVVGWFQGRMEFGPRALGNRSILANPALPHMQSIVNKKIKFRESFRPFAPTVLEEDIKTYFDLDVATPYMLLTAQTKGGKTDFPAVTHVDNSARIQSINRKQNQKYYDLIKKFKDITGLGMILNTSFNVRGEPMVRTPADALACFFGTDMDILVMDDFVVTKAENSDKIISPEKWVVRFELD